MPINHTFKTRDGCEHSSIEAAELREAMLNARDEFERAAQKLSAHILEGAQTADGHQVECGLRDYWYLHSNYGSMPRLERVTLWRHRITVAVDGPTPAMCILCERLDDSGSALKGRERFLSIEVSRLYRNEEDAQRALVALSRKRLQEFAAEIAEVEKRLAPKPRKAVN